MKRIIFTIVCFALAATQGLTQAASPEGISRAEAIAEQLKSPSSDYVVVVSHRGDWRNWPENSIPAIKSLIEMGADVMELDLKMTKDSVIVLSHDSTINRCTNGRGKVSDYTYEELQKFCLVKGNGAGIDTLHIPTLRQALEVCKDNICVNIDQGYWYYDRILEITEELGVTDQILIKGKSPLEEVAAKMASHPHNMMYMPIVDVQREKGLELLNSYLDSGTVPIAYEVCWQSGKVDPWAAKILEQGSKVWVNTLWPSLCGGYGNDDDAAYLQGAEKVYQQYLDAGVSIIQTDRPEFLIRFLESKGRHTLPQ